MPSITFDRVTSSPNKQEKKARETFLRLIESLAMASMSIDNCDDRCVGGDGGDARKGCTREARDAQGRKGLETSSAPGGRCRVLRP